MMVNNKYEIGQRLHDLRIQRKITIEELGDRLGVSVSHINQVERGYRNMSLGLLMKYISEFEVVANHILMGTTDNKNKTIEERLDKLSPDKRRYLINVFNYMIQASERQASV